MNDIVNFNKAKKARGKAGAKATAAQNRVRFGRTKAERSASKAEVTRFDRRLDQAKRED